MARTGMASLESQLEDLFPRTIRRRGRQYAKAGHVRFQTERPGAAAARVAGSNGEEYEVTTEWDAKSGVVTTDCDCPYHASTGPCKHVWAVILKLSDTPHGRGLPSKVVSIRQAQGTGVHHVGDSFDDDFELDESQGSTGEDLLSFESKQLGVSKDFLRSLVSRAIGGAAPPPPKPSRPAKPSPPPPTEWTKDLEPVRYAPWDDVVARADLLTSREFRLLIDVAQSHRDDALHLALRFRERGATGKWGKWKQLIVDLDHKPDLESPDEELVRRLADSVPPDSPRQRQSRFGFSPYSYRTPQARAALIRGTAALPLLQECCRRGLVYWCQQELESPDDWRPVTWDDGPPWELELHVAVDAPRREWVLTGRLVRQGSDRTVPLEAPTLIIPGAAVLLEDQLARGPRQEHAGWLYALQKKPEVRVPFADRNEFLTTLYSLPQGPRVVAPAELRITAQPHPPQPLLTVTPSARTGGKERRLTGRVVFSYGRNQFDPHERITGTLNPDALTIEPRDRAAEQQRMTELLSLPGVALSAERFQRRPDSQSSAAGLKSLPLVEFGESHLSRVLETLASAGWQIEADGQLIRSAGVFEFDVKSQVDWFDLEGTCDFGGVKAKLPELLKAVKAGDSYVTLSDGSRGLLTGDWRTQLERLAEYGRQEGDQMRFSGAQALLLDAMLAAKSRAVRVDSRFREVKQRLQSLHGVPPRPEPEGFQGSLRDYQREGLGWLTFLEECGFGGCLADDMGLGKTVQVLAFLEARRQRQSAAGAEHRPSIAVVPKSLIFNWLNEATRFAPQLRAAAYHGQGREGVLARAGELDLLITTYGTLRQDIGELSQRPFDYAILDEAQAIKNPTAQSAKAVRLLEARHRLAMTGTPVENHLGDLWSLFEFLNPGMLGRSQNFQTLTKRLREEPESLQALARGVGPFVLRRTKEQVLTELPEKTEQTILCELSPAERKLYDELRDHYRRSLLGQVQQEGLAKSKIHVLEALLRLRQAACHPGLVNEKHLRLASTKLETLQERLEELLKEGHKALVFSQFTSLLAILRRKLDRQKVVYEYLDGQTSNRQRCVERFQSDDDCRLFLVSLKAGGQGLNLTAADYVFILDPWWNPAVEAQAIDRAHRIGQTQHVFAYRLIAADTVEEKILALQKHKRELADSIISENTSLLQNLSVEDLQLLLS